MKNVLWDFDGVILDSMEIRDWGFREIFKEFDPLGVERFIAYHRLNGGLSRYVKIKYYFEKILKQPVSNEKVLDYASHFSRLMKKELTNPAYLIEDSLFFISKNYKNYNFHIVSGSDEKELRFLCTQLGISELFKSIHGSPTDKTSLVRILLDKHLYRKENTCLIGDSINDYDAARANNIIFYGYNNASLKGRALYIEKFDKLIL